VDKKIVISFSRKKNHLLELKKSRNFVVAIFCPMFETINSDVTAIEKFFFASIVVQLFEPFVVLLFFYFFFRLAVGKMFKAKSYFKVRERIRHKRARGRGIGS
jgi:hypothetical protein